MAALPLLFAGGYHLDVGGSGLLLVAVFLTVAVGVALDVSHGRRVDREHREAAAQGLHVWRASVTSESLLGRTRVPALVRLSRDLVPVQVEVTESGLVLRPPGRYRRLGVSEQSFAWSQVRTVQTSPLGHLRPDGTLSVRDVTGISVTFHQGGQVDLVLASVSRLIVCSASEPPTGDCY